MKKSYRNVSFLVELLINVLVFSVSCAVLVGLFAKASEVARQTKEESFASVETYALFQTVKVYGLDGISHGEEQADGSFACGYDKNWAPVNLQNAVYIITMKIDKTSTDAGMLQNIYATAINAKGNEIGAFETAVYTPQLNGEAG